MLKRKRHLVSGGHVGVWTGPGVLALLDGEWVHYLPRDVPRDPRTNSGTKEETMEHAKQDQGRQDDEVCALGRWR